MSKNDNKTLATKPATEAGLTAIPDYGTDARLGFDQNTAADYSIPFVKLLQALSPELTDPAKKIKGAEAGQILNSVTKDVANEIFFVPVDRQHSFIEWVPREKGGGFAGRHDESSPEVQKAKSANAGSVLGLKSSKGNDLKETFTLFGLILPSADAQTSDGRYACIAFDSTKIKEYKDMMYKLDSSKVRAPLFANRLRISSRAQKNAKGNSFNFAITHAIGEDLVQSLIAPGTALFEEAKAFHTMVRSGQAKADFSKQDQDDTAPDAGGHF